MEQQPTDALDELLSLDGQCQVQTSPVVAESFIEELDGVEMIEHMNRAFEVFAYRFDVGFGHVGGDGFDLGVRSAKSLPERFEGVSAFAVANDDDRAGDEIEDNGEVAVAGMAVDAKQP